MRIFLLALFLLSACSSQPEEQRKLPQAHTPEHGSQWTQPLLRTEKRVMKKPFGIFITPKNSPVSPERFRGYHTGTDFELFSGENAHDVSVLAACTGPLVFKDWVRGYGGVVVQRCELDEEPVTVLYGHLWIDSVTLSVGKELQSGDPIGVLGEGGTEETDGERAHLHFAIHRGEDVELRGYVESQEALSDWISVQGME